MITIRTTTDITTERQVVVSLPPETPLGLAEVVVVVSPQSVAPHDGVRLQGGLRGRFGSVRGRDGDSANNERIDADLAEAYGPQSE
jgi:hypothetical protein